MNDTKLYDLNPTSNWTKEALYMQFFTRPIFPLTLKFNMCFN